MHWFEEKVWVPIRQQIKQPEYASFYENLESQTLRAIGRCGLGACPPEVQQPGEAWLEILRDLHDVYLSKVETRADNEVRADSSDPADEDQLEVDEERSEESAPNDGASWAASWETKRKDEWLEKVRLHDSSDGLSGMFSQCRRDMSLLNFFHGYREAKSIYRVNRHLYEALARLDVPEGYPVEAMMLPRRSIVIDFSDALPGTGSSVDQRHLAIGATYDLAPGKEAEGCLMIRFVMFASFLDCGFGWTPLADVELSLGHSIKEGLANCRIAFEAKLAAFIREEVAPYGENPGSLDWAFESGEHFCGNVADWSRFSEDERIGLRKGVDRRLVGDDPFLVAGIDYLAVAINVLLYIHGEDDVVREVHPGEKPPKTAKNPAKAERFKNLAAPTVFRVGQRYGATVERWEREMANNPSDGGSVGGSKKRPHMRGAHPHLYWVGTGRKDARVRFLLPIAVKGGSDRELPPTVAPVK